jgi:hypothetical protein
MRKTQIKKAHFLLDNRHWTDVPKNLGQLQKSGRSPWAIPSTCPERKIHLVVANSLLVLSDLLFLRLLLGTEKRLRSSTESFMPEILVDCMRRQS